jgi:hypothetical protein
MLCIASAGAVTALAVSSFTLSWNHSVEHTRWQETWQVEAAGLRVVSARVEGSGAGIALPPDATWTKGGWTYRPDVPALETVRLAASGKTDGGWQLCAGDTCFDLGAEAGQDAVLTSAPACLESP